MAFDVAEEWEGEAWEEAAVYAEVEASEMREARKAVAAEEVPTQAQESLHRRESVLPDSGT